MGNQHITDLDTCRSGFWHIGFHKCIVPSKKIENASNGLFCIVSTQEKLSIPVQWLIERFIEDLKHLEKINFSSY